MDFIRNLLGQTPNVSVEVPVVGQWFSEMPPAYMVMICMSITFSCISILLGAVHLLYVLKYISNNQIQTDLYWVVFMCPVVSLCGTIGMILPRSATFLYAVALVYFMICIFVMVTLMTTLHGSRQAMCEKLLQRNVKISVRVMPLGCCLFCFPKLDPTDRNFRRIEWLVFQSPLVRIFLEIMNIIVFFELNNRTHLYFQVSNLIGMCSLFVGSYGSYMIIPAGSAYRFQLMFRMVDLSQLAYSVQKFFFDFLAAVGVFQNGPLLPDTAAGQFYTSFLLTLEMLALSVMATIFFRPSQTIFFDKYKHEVDRMQENLSASSQAALQQRRQRHARDHELGVDNGALSIEASCQSPGHDHGNVRMQPQQQVALSAAPHGFIGLDEELTELEEEEDRHEQDDSHKLNLFPRFNKLVLFEDRNNNNRSPAASSTDGMDDGSARPHRTETQSTTTSTSATREDEAEDATPVFTLRPPTLQLHPEIDEPAAGQQPFRSYF